MNWRWKHNNDQFSGDAVSSLTSRRVADADTGVTIATLVGVAHISHGSLDNVVQLWMTRLASVNRLDNKLPSIEVIPTALAGLMTMTFAYDLDLQSPASYGQLPHDCGQTCNLQ